MTKIRLNNTHRDILRKYGQEKIAALIDRKKEHELYATILMATNSAIRLKYPEEHMVTLRIYKLTRQDRCITFSFPSGRTDGFWFNEDKEMVDVPSRGGCLSSVAYPVNAAFEKAYDEYAKVKKANREEEEKRQTSFRVLIDVARMLEEVMEIIDLPKDLQERLGKKSQALVALNDDSLKQLKKDFAIKKAA